MRLSPCISLDLLYTHNGDEPSENGCVCLLVVGWLMAAVLTLCVEQTGRGVLRGNNCHLLQDNLKVMSKDVSETLEPLYQNERRHNP